MAEKKSFVIYADWEELVCALENNEQAGELFKALFAFAKRGERAEFEGALKMAFLMMSQQIARDSEKWEKKSRKNAENYQKRKSENSDRFSNIQHDSAGDTVTDNDTVNDTVTVIDNVLPPARKKERILWVYEALRNQTQDLDFALYYCGNPRLKTTEAKHDSLHLDPHNFYKKYRYYNKNRLIPDSFSRNVKTSPVTCFGCGDV